jgi:hypothetical protein
VCVRLSVITFGYSGCKGQRFVEVSVVGQCKVFALPASGHAGKQESRQISHM